MMRLVMVLALTFLALSRQANAELKQGLKYSVVLNLPKESFGEWKTVVDERNQVFSLMRKIPVTQAADDLTYALIVGHSPIMGYSPENNYIQLFQEHMKMEAEFYYDTYQTAFRVVEQGDDYFIYEMLAHKTAPEARIFFQVGRYFVKEGILYQVGYQNRFEMPDIKTREKWIDLFKNQVWLIPTPELDVSTALEPENFKKSLNLGSYFKKWTPKNKGILVNWTPPSKTNNYTSESLDVIAVPELEHDSIEPYFTQEKKMLTDKMGQDLNFEVLFQTPTEVIYSYSRPFEKAWGNVVARSFITPQGYYQIKYVMKRAKKMDDYTTNKLRKALEGIKVRKCYQDLSEIKVFNAETPRKIEYKIEKACGLIMTN